MPTLSTTLNETDELNRDTVETIKDAVLGELHDRGIPEPWSVRTDDVVEQTVDDSGDWTIAVFQNEDDLDQLAALYVLSGGNALQLYVDRVDKWSEPIDEVGQLVDVLEELA